MRRSIRLFRKAKYIFFTVQQLQVGANLALRMPTNQSSTSSFQNSSLAVDGLFNTRAPYCAVTNDSAGGPNWWMVDLQQLITIGYVVLTNRADCCGEADEFPSSTFSSCSVSIDNELPDRKPILQTDQNNEINKHSGIEPSYVPPPLPRFPHVV